MCCVTCLINKDTIYEYALGALYRFIMGMAITTKGMARLNRSLSTLHVHWGVVPYYVCSIHNAGTFRLQELPRHGPCFNLLCGLLKFVSTVVPT